jgi:hypothetical protein
MFCQHGRYTLGDPDAEDPRDPDAEDGKLRAEVAAGVALPLYLYDHSGITMSASREYPFNCPWDAGCVGMIYATRDKILAHFQAKRMTKKLRERATAGLLSEVEEYDWYLTGECYGFVLERGGEDDDGEVSEWEEVDSCWGFLGPVETNGILDHLAPEFHAMAKEADIEYDH